MFRARYACELDPDSGDWKPRDDASRKRDEEDRHHALAACKLTRDDRESLIAAILADPPLYGAVFRDDTGAAGGGLRIAYRFSPDRNFLAGLENLPLVEKAAECGIDDALTRRYAPERIGCHCHVLRSRLEASLVNLFGDAAVRRISSRADFTGAESRRATRRDMPPSDRWLSGFSQESAADLGQRFGGAR